MHICYLALSLLFAVTLLSSWIHQPKELSNVDLECFSFASDEVFWRSIAAAIFVPLTLEYLLDVVQELTYHLLADEKNIAEDKNDHGLIVGSLIPASYIPIWLLGRYACHNRGALVSFSNAMLLCGVVGKLQTFGGDVWKAREARVVVVLYMLGEAAAILGGNFDHGELSYTYVSLITTLVLKFLAALVFIASSRNFKLVFRELKRQPPHMYDLFTTRSYLCSMLFFGLVWFFVQSLRFHVRALSLWPIQIRKPTADRIFVLITVVILTAVMPGRTIRRGMKAVEQTRIVQKELNNKKTFVSYISHEVRSPLSTASLGLDCLVELIERRKRMRRSELRDLVNDTRVACATALRTLNDLLLFDKIESSMIELELQSVSCRSFLLSCLKPFVRQLKVAGIFFEADIDEKLSNKQCMIDRMKMEQVLRNFLGNAAKFTPTDGKIAVNAQLLPEKASLSTPQAMDSDASETKEASSLTPASPAKMRVEVTDTGVGISEENLRKLFSPYVQINAEKLQEGKGTGLGLWISRSIVNMHKGTVGACSAGESHGSTFYFELPCYEGLPSDEADETIDEKPSGAAGEIIRIPSDAPTPIRAPLSRETRLLQVSLLNGHVEDIFCIENSQVDESTPLSTESVRSVSTPTSEPNILTAEKDAGVPSDVTVASAIVYEPRKLKLLVADDAPITRKLVTRMIIAALPLTEISHAINGSDAAQQVIASLQPITTEAGVHVAAKPFDVVVIDYYMPNMDGPEAIQEMRRAGFEGLIFGVTAASSFERSNLLTAGANYIMLKPFDIKVFVHAVCEKFGEEVAFSQ